jgi:hypothetical protein
MDCHKVNITIILKVINLDLLQLEEETIIYKQGQMAYHQKHQVQWN